MVVRKSNQLEQIRVPHLPEPLLQTDKRHPIEALHLVEAIRLASPQTKGAQHLLEHILRSVVIRQHQTEAIRLSVAVHPPRVLQAERIRQREPQRRVEVILQVEVVVLQELPRPAEATHRVEVPHLAEAIRRAGVPRRVEVILPVGALVPVEVLLQVEVLVDEDDRPKHLTEI